ncbi:hypothetical protein K9N68_33105 [Kovacikia minuta CCNUW1]|uniref:hypothetical protein n=1 Tax=Kovacikia minuta TaxID=2931930 RepID=UPI001CCDF483|nr:hypothetical protein [Kovacikia minuta]UBF26289.1 hypothetical protein K9N68_33105 [Kovacikia minuta CCNUW1]
MMQAENPTVKKWMAAIAGLTVGTSLLGGIALSQKVPTRLRQGMPYDQARQILLEAGWQAVELSPNRERFSPMDYLIDQLGYNEVEDCSGTGMGYCRFSFADANGRKLSVVTVDNQQGQQPKLSRWWIDTESR